MAVLNNQIYCASNFSDTVECMDVNTEKWSVLPSETKGGIIEQLVTHKDCLYAVTNELIEKYDFNEKFWFKVILS